MPSNERPGAVVIGSGGFSTLTTVRALGSNGIRVALVLTRAGGIARWSRWRGRYQCLTDFAAAPDSLVDFLLARAAQWRGWALIPTDDTVLGVLSRHRDRLADSFASTVPPWEATGVILSKPDLYRIAQQLGIAVPQDYGPATAATVERTDIQFPVVVKPPVSAGFVRHFGVQVLVAPDRDALRERVRLVEAAGLPARVLELIPGPDSQTEQYCAYLDRNGAVAADLTVHKLRKSPPFFGVVRAARVADLPHLREPTLALLRRIGWRGMVNVEYKRDPRDGRRVLMDVNGRAFIMMGTALRAGINYPLMAWREAVLGEAGRAEWNGWSGTWVNLLDDFYYFAAHRKTEKLSLGAYLASYRLPLAFATFSWADPLPFLAHAGQQARKVLSGPPGPKDPGGIAIGVQGMPGVD